MNLKHNIKRITNLYESCNNCGLPKINCICNKVNEIKSEAQFWILSSEKEIIRASNTARVLKLINKESTEIYIWERKNEPKELIEKIESNKYDIYLLFPTDERTKERKVTFKKGEKIPAFIIIDGTWKEAKKIFRKSSYLENLNIIEITSADNSNFILRRGVEPGNLCTIESAIEMLNINNEHKLAKRVHEAFELFQYSYKCGQSGHKVKNNKF